MKVQLTEIPGLLRLEPFVARDARGAFVKVFQREQFMRESLACEFAEEYVTVSAKGVLRGLHFQVPPHEQTKLVFCAAGKVLDAVLDIRLGSPMFGRHVLFTLSGAQPTILSVPPGCAHGFYVMEGPAIMLYKVTSTYAPEHDRGIRWDSAGIAWPTREPLLSDRDRDFPTLAAFETPFQFAEVAR